MTGCRRWPYVLVGVGVGVVSVAVLTFLTARREKSLRGFGATGGSIKSMQHMLASMGLQVQITGVIDQATVGAINGVFAGWDDAPPAFRTGQLTAHDIAKHLPLVAKLVHQAAGGALVFHDVNGE